VDQLSLHVEAPVDPELRWAWSGLPFRDVRACAGCGEQRPCAGRRRTSQRCLACFAEANRPKRRRRTARAAVGEGSSTVPRP
jgi:hypothetical protein